MLGYIKRLKYIINLRRGKCRKLSLDSSTMTLLLKVSMEVIIVLLSTGLFTPLMSSPPQSHCKVVNRMDGQLNLIFRTSRRRSTTNS